LRLLPFALILSFAASCTAAEPDGDPVRAQYRLGVQIADLKWNGATSRPLAFDKYSGPLGTSATPLYVRFLEHVQPPGAVVTHEHLGELLYGLQGEQVLQQRIDERTFDSRLKATEGGNVVHVTPTFAHEHRNTGGGTHRWISIAIRSLEQPASAEFLFPDDRVLFATPHLPELGGHVGYGHALHLVRIEPRGRTAIHRPTTLLVVYVLEGEAEIRYSRGTNKNLRAGEGAHFWAPHAVEIAAVGAQPTALLEYFATRLGDSVYQEELRRWPAPGG
jgi:hypothetical protein